MSLRALYRATHFLPSIATLAPMAIALEALLHSTIGLVNQALSALARLPTANRLRDEDTVLPILAVIGTTQEDLAGQVRVRPATARGDNPQARTGGPSGGVRDGDG